MVFCMYSLKYLSHITTTHHPPPLHRYPPPAPLLSVIGKLGFIIVYSNFSKEYKMYNELIELLTNKIKHCKQTARGYNEITDKTDSDQAMVYTYDGQAQAFTEVLNMLTDPAYRDYQYSIFHD